MHSGLELGHASNEDAREYGTGLLSLVFWRAGNWIPFLLDLFLMDVLLIFTVDVSSAFSLSSQVDFHTIYHGY